MRENKTLILLGVAGLILNGCRAIALEHHDELFI